MLRSIQPCRLLKRSCQASMYTTHRAKSYSVITSTFLRPSTVLFPSLILQPSTRRWKSITTPTVRTTTTRTTTSAAEKTHCPGCGAPFQSDQPDYPGYLTPLLDPSSTTKTASTTSTTRKTKSGQALSHEEYEALVKSLDPETRALLEGIPVSDIDKDQENHDNGDDKNTMVHKEATSEVKKDEPVKRTVCQRCHQLTHHHRKEAPDAGFLRASQQHSSLSFLRTKQRPMILYVMDVMDMPWSLKGLQHILDIQPDARVMIAANKVDLLPTSSLDHQQRLRDYIFSTLKQHVHTGGQNTIQSITLMSAIKGWGVKGCLAKLQQKLLPTDDLYVVGSVNAGKSALINRLVTLSRTMDKQQYHITSSNVPGTTMGMIRIPLHALGLSQPQHQHQNNDSHRRAFSRDHYLIDTPGLIDNDDNLHPMILATQTEQQQVLNKKRQPLKPTTFRLYHGQSMLLGKARIDVTHADKPILMTLFTPLAPHITKTTKLNTASDDQDNSGNSDEETKMELKYPQLEVVSTHGSHASMELAFVGIGWVALTGGFDRATVDIWLPQQTSRKAFSLRPAFLPFEYKGQIRKFFGSGARATH